jgi:hypothetical protein
MMDDGRNNTSEVNVALWNDEDDPDLDAMLLEADRLAAEMQNWNHSDDSSPASESAEADECCGESYESSGSFHADALSAEHESLLVPSLNPTSNTNVDVDDMLRKAEVLMTEMRRSSSGGLPQQYGNNMMEQELSPNNADVNGDVDDMLNRAEMLAARMHSASQTSLDKYDDEGVLLPPDLDLLMLKIGSELSSADYSNSADTGVDTPDVIEQTEEILKRMDTASNDGTTTSTSLGSNMAVSSQMGKDHGRRVAKAEEMARLMQEALSSHMPFDAANDLLHANEDNEDVIERVVTALKKTASEEERESKFVETPRSNSNKGPQRDELLSAAPGSVRSSSMRSGSIRSSMSDVPPPPNPPPLSRSIPEMVVGPPVKVLQEQFPSERDPDFVPVADYRSKKASPQPAVRKGVASPPKPPMAPENISKGSTFVGTVSADQVPTERDSDFVPVLDYRSKSTTPTPRTRPSPPSVPKVVAPPPPRRTALPAVVSIDDEDFVPVADFSIISSKSAMKNTTQESASPRSVRWEKVERAFQHDDDFVPLMDFRKSAPTKQPAAKKSILAIPKRSRKARRRMLVRGVIVAVVVGYIGWRLYASSRTRLPILACDGDIDHSRCDVDRTSLNKSDYVTDADQEVKDPNELLPTDVIEKVHIIWNYPDNICRPEEEWLSSGHEGDGVCEVVDLARRDDNESFGKQKRGLRLPPFVCRIPHLANLLARHCRNPSV